LIDPELFFCFMISLNYPNMIKVGTFGGEMDKIGTFSVTEMLGPL